jgi:hypothetical protein
MKHSRQKIATDVTFKTSDVFSRMGVAMEELMAAAPNMLSKPLINGIHECHGKRKESKRAA